MNPVPISTLQGHRASARHVLEGIMRVHLVCPSTCQDHDLQAEDLREAGQVTTPSEDKVNHLEETMPQHPEQVRDNQESKVLLMVSSGTS